MRIGIMLRTFDETGGIGVYSRNIVAELLNRDKRNEYILFYRNPAHLGTHTGRANVHERVVVAPHKTMWDQIAIPAACRRESVDVLFHPKFTAPLLASCPVVMTVHGADWFIEEQAQYYHPFDVGYMRLMMPLYLKKCASVISVSQLTTENFQQVFGLPDGKVQTVYFAPARQFHRVEDAEILTAVRARYALPLRFMLTLSKRAGDRRKNLGQIFRAYAAYHASVAQPVPLVVGGKDCHLFRDEYHLPTSGYGRDIHFPGWLEQADLPAIYTLADLYLYPSNLEAFPIPVTEAMACGTPVITSNANGLQEIAGDAALLVDRQDANAIRDAICRLMADPDLRQTLSTKGQLRARQFSWDVCAERTLSILEAAACR